MSRFRNHRVRRGRAWQAAACVLLATAAGARADVVQFANKSFTKTATLSDLYAFSQQMNQGVKTEILKKGDPTDDINIAPRGFKNITVPNGTRSLTVSWMRNGQEVESDVPMPHPAIPLRLAFLTKPGGVSGEIAVAYDNAPGAVPEEDFIGTVTNGKIDGRPEFSWFTIYDTTLTDGFIVRDPDGVPINPLYTGDIESAFVYEISLVPSPASLSLLGCAGIAATRRRR